MDLLPPAGRPVPLAPQAPDARGEAIASRVGAALDIGSNSVHLLVAAVRGHELARLVDESVFLGLAHRVDEAGYLGPEARSRRAAVLGGYAATARDHGATDVTLLGTEPLRRAGDAARVVAEIALATGAGLHVISHEEEASLTLIGVTSGRPLETELAVVDIGGGSTEVVDARPGRPIEIDGIAIGSARLTAAIVEHDPPTRDELAALRAEAAARVAALPRSTARVIVAAGGTASNLAKVLDLAGVRETTDDSPRDPFLTRRRLEAALEILLAGRSAEVAERFQLNPVRARVLPAGAAILEAILDRYEAPGVRVVDEGLREGAVLAVSHAGASWRDRLPALVAGWS